VVDLEEALAISFFDIKFLKAIAKLQIWHPNG
jgi:hypothetical protein